MAILPTDGPKLCYACERITRKRSGKRPHSDLTPKALAGSLGRVVGNRVGWHPYPWIPPREGRDHVPPHRGGHVPLRNPSGRIPIPPGREPPMHIPPRHVPPRNKPSWDVTSRGITHWRITTRCIPPRQDPSFRVPPLACPCTLGSEGLISQRLHRIPLKLFGISF